MGKNKGNKAFVPTMAEKAANSGDMQFSCIGYHECATPTVFDKKTSKDYISWGEDNKFPQYLYDLYLKNSNLQAVVNNITDYVMGENIQLSNELVLDANTLSKCVFDYILFGGFALEGLRSASGDIVQLNHIDVQWVRVNEDLTTAYISSKWGSFKPDKLDILPLFSESEKQNHFIYYYRGKVTRNINPIPSYVSALKSVEILNSTRNYHLHNLENNFAGSVVVSLNGTSIKASELQAIKKQLEGEYTGTDNAGKVLLINNANSEGKVEVSRLTPDNAGDLYQNLAKSAEDDIFVAFRMNPILCGKNVATGFSKEEFEQAFALFYATVIKPMQATLTACLEDLGQLVTFNKFIIDWGE
jgi:capsid portal protein